MSNRLIHETSPYLLQHADNPVQWYPWGEEAFRRAKTEDKPVFLSIGYSTCHWCHVMAHESFEDKEIADLLNRHFIAVKVDKEERPDIDSIYMAVCQAFTGSGGWPTSIFMTPDQQPFFAGTYFPRRGRGGLMGLREILIAVHEAWMADRPALLAQAKDIVAGLSHRRTAVSDEQTDLPGAAADLFRRIYDSKYGGFGRAPKFPTPHNLLFLLAYYRRTGQRDCLSMAEHTLLQMYRGGMFDHIGFGFCRYSTDRQFLVPHFEKMLYDNALLILAYCRAHEVSPQSGLWLEIAEKTADYILREMTAPEGGFYSAQDADSEGEEGKFYLFTPEEIIRLLGEQTGEAFNRHYDITPAGNFEGRNIPNLLHSDPEDHRFAPHLAGIAEYRKTRYALHLDDKILTAWNGLMIAAMCALCRASGKTVYRDAAQQAERFIRVQLCEGETLFVSFRAGRRGVKGFLDDYAAWIFAQLALYGVTLEAEYLDRARLFCDRVLRDFADPAGGGFFLSAADSEALILRPKETYDGAIPSGNALMAYNLVRLSHLTGDPQYGSAAKDQLAFLSAEAAEYPTGHSMFLLALLEDADPPVKVVVVPADAFDPTELIRALPADAIVTRLKAPTTEYRLKEGKTTFYICHGRTCLPPTNDWKEALRS